MALLKQHAAVRLVLCQDDKLLGPWRRAESISTQRARVEILGVPGVDEAHLQPAIVRFLVGPGIRRSSKKMAPASEDSAGVTRT